MSEELLDLSALAIDPAVALALPAQLARRRRVLPFARLDGHVAAACVDCEDDQVLRTVQRYFAEPVRLHRAEPASLEQAIARTYREGERGPGTAGLRRQGSGSRILRVDALSRPDNADLDDAVALANELLHAAVLRRASDLHLDPTRDGLRVRLRVDGALEDYQRLPMSAHPGLLSRFKVLAGMDIAERRAPQDGRFSHPIGGAGSVDLRAATLPTKWGERLTVRLLALDPDLTLERLGMTPAQLASFDRALGLPHGLILVTGPTGSGKSTTLHAGLRRLVTSQRLNTISIEDPIEFDMEGVGQVEVDSHDKVGFARALRSVLRHDPDVIMIGEVRDELTAEVAVKAALTGHLVLSTLHTNTAAGAITRLNDLGLERFLIAATLRLSMAQRLVRRLCPACRVPARLEPSQAELLGAPQASGEEVFAPGSCLRCAGRGYAGRVGLFELLPIDRDCAERIGAGADEAALLAGMRAGGLPDLAAAGLARLREGVTAFDEVAAAVAVW